MYHSNAVTSNKDISYKIPGKLNCQSRNVIYVLTCGTHNVQYVGETQQTLNARFRLHESMINTKKENPVADYLNDENQQEQKTKTRGSMDAIIDYTLSKWPKFQVVAVKKEEI